MSTQLSLIDGGPASDPKDLPVNFHGLRPPDDLAGRPSLEGLAMVPFDLVTWRGTDADGKECKLERNALAVALYLDSIAGRGWVYCWKIDDAIARACKMPLRTVQSGLADLRSAGFVRAEQREFRGKTRRVLWLLWKVPASLPRIATLVPAPRPHGVVRPPKRGRDSAAHCAGNSAAHCAVIDPSDEGQRIPLRSDSAAHCAPRPYSNSSPGFEEEEKRHVTCARAGEDENPEPNRPPPVALIVAETPPPPPPQPAAVEDDDPTPELVAEWERLVNGPRKHGGDVALARLGLNNWREILARRAAPPPPIPALTPKLASWPATDHRPAPPPAPQSGPADTETLVRRLVNPAFHPDAALEAAARRLAETLDDHASLGAYFQVCREVRADQLSVSAVLSAHRAALGRGVVDKPKIFMWALRPWRPTEPSARKDRPAGSTLPVPPPAGREGSFRVMTNCTRGINP